MIVAFDVSHMLRRRAGLGRFSVVMLRSLLSADRERTYVLHGWSRDLDEEAIRSFVQPNVRLSIARIPGAVKRMYWNYLRFPELQKIIGPFDVFHGAEPLLPPVGNNHSIVTVHDLAYKKFPHFFDEWTARKWDFLYRRSIQKADAVIVPSVNTRNDLLEMISLPPEKVHVIRPPVNPAFSGACPADVAADIRMKYSIADQYILFVGTIEPRKNIPGLIRAFEILQGKTSHPLSLVIVGGTGWSFSDIMTTITTSKAAKNIILPGYVDDTSLAALYRSALMFVFPSFYEGHGFPVVEAMASGIPVITSNNSSLKEIGDGASILVDPDNSEQISEAMERLYLDEALRAELALKGRQRAAQFSVKNAVDGILRLYTSFEKN